MLRISPVRRLLGLEQLQLLRLGPQGGTVETTKQVTEFLWTDVESWTRYGLACWTLKTRSGEILLDIGWGMGVPKRTMKLIDLRVASHVHQLPRHKKSYPT